MHYLWILFTYYIRPFVKWFLRKTTGLCELQRICYGEPQGALRTHAVEGSLRLSRHPLIRNIVRNLDSIGTEDEFRVSNGEYFAVHAVSAILRAKKINARVHLPFTRGMTVCVEKIWGYYRLVHSIECLRTTVYDSENLEHEVKLCGLWDELRPEEALVARVTKQWQEIGFQGDDPKTDFRGMGLLGLENLLYFVTRNKDAAKHVYSHSQHPVYGYAFAVVGINLTSMAWNLLKSGGAKTYFFNVCKDVPSVDDFHQFYSVLFYEFDRFWVDCKPKNIMEFSIIKDKFEKSVTVRLRDPQEMFEIFVPIVNV